MYNHDPEPPANPPLPGKPLDQLQVSEARHVLLHVSQSCSDLRTALSAMSARSDQQQLVTSERVARQIGYLADDLGTLAAKLGGPEQER
jgi:hypothetical protein